MSTRLTAGDIAFTVTRRKNMRTIRLHVKPGGVVGVSCPLDVPDAELVALVEGRAGWIAAKRAELADTPRAHAEQASEEEKCAWKTLVEAAVPLLLEKWEPVMGVRARKLAYRNMKSRWGSCRRVTGRFSFALDLVTKPKECIEAVVVHELCHLFIAGHGPDFYARMETYLPDYKERDRLLASLPRELI